MGGAILGRHQRQVHQIAARQHGADRQARKAALRQIPFGLVISSGSSSGCLASSTTRAVISLVIEAIGAATSELREYRTDESLWSTMSTELDLSFGVGVGFAVARETPKRSEVCRLTPLAAVRALD